MPRRTRASPPPSSSAAMRAVTCLRMMFQRMGCAGHKLFADGDQTVLLQWIVLQARTARPTWWRAVPLRHLRERHPGKNAAIKIGISKTSASISARWLGQRKILYESRRCYKLSGNRPCPGGAGRDPAGLRRTDPRSRLGAETGPRRGHRVAAAHQAGAGPDGAGHPHRPHRGAQQDAPAAGPGAPGDLPDRRLHQPDRRPVRPQQHPPAADARADQGQCRDLLQAGQPGAGPGADRDPLQQRMVRCRWARSA